MNSVKWILSVNKQSHYCVVTKAQHILNKPIFFPWQQWKCSRAFFWKGRTPTVDENIKYYKIIFIEIIALQQSLTTVVPGSWCILLKNIVLKVIYHFSSNVCTCMGPCRMTFIPCLCLHLKNTPFIFCCFCILLPLRPSGVDSSSKKQRVNGLYLYIKQHCLTYAKWGYTLTHNTGCVTSHAWERLLGAYGFHGDKAIPFDLLDPSEDSGHQELKEALFLCQKEFWMKIDGLGMWKRGSGIKESKMHIFEHVT